MVKSSYCSCKMFYFCFNFYRSSVFFPSEINFLLRGTSCKKDPGHRRTLPQGVQCLTRGSGGSVEAGDWAGRRGRGGGRAREVSEGSEPGSSARPGRSVGPAGRRVPNATSVAQRSGPAIHQGPQLLERPTSHCTVQPPEPGVCALQENAVP